VSSKKVIILLASVQFIFTLDTTFMNVSISTLVQDLHTTVTAIQTAITFYTLVMAAFMIAGAKIGDIIGRKRAFIVGLSIYALGSLITSLSPNIQILTIGWSFLEGIGASLAIPAMFSLITGNYPPGQARAKAYGMLAAMGAVGAATGPIVGGLLTTYASWRLGFAGEVVISGWVLLQHKAIQDAPLGAAKPKFDFVGFILSAAGLTTVVTGILLANTYGLVKSRGNFSIGGVQIAHTGGVSPTIIFVIAGLIILAGFIAWQAREIRLGHPSLVNPKLLKIRAVSAGISSVLMQQFLIAGVIFALSVYLQLAVGYNAFETGLTLLPMSIALLIIANIGARLVDTFEPRSMVMGGFAILLVGVAWLGARVGHLGTGMEFFLPMVIIGVGLGFTASQLGNLVQSSVEQEYTSEASGLSSTFQNLGSSLGTALAGSIIISVLISTSLTLIQSNTVLNTSQKSQYTQALAGSVSVLSNQQVQTKLAGQPQDVVNAVVSINSQARDKSLSVVLVALAIVGLLGLVSAWLLPKRKLSGT
jgi:MFS family permease